MSNDQSSIFGVDFVTFPKVPRLYRPAVYTEKIDGTNASVYICYPGEFHGSQLDEKVVAKVGDTFVLAGSRTRWITPEDDNFGFAAWVKEHAEELVNLGPGHHFGEWWGRGIQRGYGLDERRFSLFNVGRWMSKTVPGTYNTENLIAPPACCHVVPILGYDTFGDYPAEVICEGLRRVGSIAAPGFMKPEGVMIYHTAAGHYFKKTLERDEEPKGAK